METLARASRTVFAVRQLQKAFPTVNRAHGQSYIAGQLNGSKLKDYTGVVLKFEVS